MPQVFTCTALLFDLFFRDGSLPPNVGELVRGWSWVQKSTGGMLGNRECDKLAEVVKATTVMKTRQLVAEANGRPTLCSYSNDDTPMKFLKKVVPTGPLGRVVRVGGAGHELLVQRAVFRTRGSTGEWRT